MAKRTDLTSIATALFTRSGDLYCGQYNLDARGNASFTRQCKCNRCGGAGRSDRWAHTGYTCFDCRGSGNSPRVETVKLYSAEKLTVLNARKAKADAKRAVIAQEKAEARAAEIAARADAFKADNAELLDRAANHMDNAFINDVVTRATQNSQITEAQAAAVMTAIERIETRKAQAAASRHVGKVGERLEAVVTVERATYFERPKFGASWLVETVHVVTMRDDAGNAIISMSPSFCAKVGLRFTLRATIKDHSEYNGQQQTKVARAKAVELREAA